MINTAAIECDEFLPYPSGVVWRAITTPEVVATYCLPPIS